MSSEVHDATAERRRNVRCEAEDDADEVWPGADGR